MTIKANTLGDAMLMYNITHPFDFRHSKQYVYIPPYRPNKCIQIVSSSYLSKTYCSLPPYCKQTTYLTTSSGWFTEVGVCVGILSSPMTLTISTTAQSGNYNLMDDNWFEYIPLKIHPDFEEHGVHIVEYYRDQTYLLYNNGRFGLISKDFIENYVRLNPLAQVIPPTIRYTTDGLACIMTFYRKGWPHIDIHDSLHQMLHAEAIPVEVIERVPHHKHTVLANRTLSYAGTGGWTKIGEYKLDHYNPTLYVKCDAHVQTTSILPLNLDSLPHVIAHSVTVVFEHIFYTLVWGVHAVVGRLYDYVVTAGLFPHLATIIYTQFRFNNTLFTIMVTLLTFIVLPSRQSYVFA